MTRLVCPLCRSVVSDGPDPVAGECPGCGAAFAGDGASPQEAVSAALFHWGLPDDPEAFTRTLFSVDPDDPNAPAAIASDEREGFYRWWVFRPAGRDTRG